MDSPTKNEYSAGAVAAPEEGVVREGPRVDLHRGLKARHITMIGMQLLFFTSAMSHRWCYWDGIDYRYRKRSCQVSVTHKFANSKELMMLTSLL